VTNLNGKEINPIPLRVQRRKVLRPSPAPTEAQWIPEPENELQYAAFASESSERAMSVMPEMGSLERTVTHTFPDVLRSETLTELMIGGVLSMRIDTRSKNR
jgi:hypothetical protein